MKIIKSMILAGVFLVSGATMAQNDAPKPTFEKDGDLIKGTFYYEDGSVRQKGTYKDGELHGEWVSYDQNGEKKAIATYENGQKHGKWFFWEDNKLTEVDYKSNQIASVNKWTSESSLVSNQ